MSDRGLQLLNWYGGAYWAFDDGTGYIVSQYVQWKADSLNDFSGE